MRERNFYNRKELRNLLKLFWEKKNLAICKHNVYLSTCTKDVHIKYSVPLQFLLKAWDPTIGILCGKDYCKLAFRCLYKFHCKNTENHQRIYFHDFSLLKATSKEVCSVATSILQGTSKSNSIPLSPYVLYLLIKKNKQDNNKTTKPRCYLSLSASCKISFTADKWILLLVLWQNFKFSIWGFRNSTCH